MCTRGGRQAFRDKKRKLPVIVSVTVETMGTMLMGTDISAALTVIEPYDMVDIIGMNCATGPKEMEENIRYLCHNSPKNVFCMPNAGIPENVSGKAHYHLSPDEMEKWATLFVKDFGVKVVGGCCGTNAEHIKKLSEVSERISPAERKWEYTSSVASLYSISTMTINPAPVLVGERCNANGRDSLKIFLKKKTTMRW